VVVGERRGGDSSSHVWWLRRTIYIVSVIMMDGQRRVEDELSEGGEQLHSRQGIKEEGASSSSRTKERNRVR